MTFKVNSTADGSFVMPEYPFSIIDKMNALKGKGFTRQLLDFSKTKVSKGNVKDIISLIQNHGTVEGASRFNWKDGFYDPERIEAFKAMSQDKNRQSPSSVKKGRR